MKPSLTRQVFTITPTGGIEGLQRKPGQGVDLRRFGRAQIVRASEIVWQEDAQAWCIDFLTPPEPFRGPVTLVMLIAADALRLAQTDVLGPGGVCLFPEYDQAVAAEVRLLDHLRRSGRLNA